MPFVTANHRPESTADGVETVLETVTRAKLREGCLRDSVLRLLCGAKSGNLARRIAETHQTPAIRTQQRIEALTKTANFHDEARYDCASVW